MRILSAEAMREVDRQAIEEVGIPSLVLMENAAIGLADAVGQLGDDVEDVAIFCGPGNNGGDGLALARHLDARGYGVEVFVISGGRELRGDAAAQLSICRKQEIPLREVTPEEDAWEVVAEAMAADLLVDALFGTGLKRPLEGQLAQLVQALNECPQTVLAVDVPSGLSGSRWELPGPHVRADLTVTFAAPKIANILPPAADAGGELVVTDLGIPPRLVEEVEEEGGPFYLVLRRDLTEALAGRPAASHKGDFGHVLLVAGSPGKAGAATLAAQGAVRSGAGLVTVAVPSSLLALVDGASLESMTLPLAEGVRGEIAEAAVSAVLEAAVGKSVVGLGPGLGQQAETREVIRRMVADLGAPLVLDADGVNAFAGDPEALAARPAPTILTPHPGELGRLLGISTSQVQADRLAAAREAARRTGAVVVLKGHQTLVAAPSSEVHLVPSGNPGMATGGSGDVLTGLVAGLVAQGGDLLEKVILGAYLHGLAGDLAVDDLGPEALAARDLLNYLPKAFEALRV